MSLVGTDSRGPTYKYVSFLAFPAYTILTHYRGVENRDYGLGSIDSVSVDNSIIAAISVVGVLPGPAPTPVDHDIIFSACVTE